MSAELKPCPFCGGSASIERYGDRRQSTIYRCDNCSCSLETGEEWDHGRQWNERARPRPDVEPVTPTDLEELLKFAFTAGAGLLHPLHWDEETEKRWKEFTPCPRSTYQRVEAAVYPEKKV